MKSIIKLNLVLMIIFTGTLMGFSQENEFKTRVDANSMLLIERMISDLVIEGYDGSELQITAKSYNPPPERAEGLRSLYNDKKDNTGIGLVVEQTNGNVRIEPASRQGAKGEYVLKVPASMSLKIDYSNPHAGDVKVNNMSGEIDITTLGGDIKLQDISGPAIVSSINGDVNAVFTALSQNGPTSIESINGEIDLKIPASTSANLELSTINGDVYTNFDMDMEKKEESMRRIGGSSKFKGTINGGGVSLKLKSINSIIYLRKL